MGPLFSMVEQFRRIDGVNIEMGSLPLQRNKSKSKEEEESVGGFGYYLEGAPNPLLLLLLVDSSLSARYARSVFQPELLGKRGGLGYTADGRCAATLKNRSPSWSAYLPTHTQRTREESTTSPHEVVVVVVALFF